MIKGLLTGSFFGLLIGGVGVIVASLAAQQPAGNTPPAPPFVDAPQTATGPVVDEAAPQEPDTLNTETDLAGAPLVVAPLAEPTAPIADTEPLALPETAAVEGALSAPDVVSLPDLAADAEAPVLPNPQSVAPQIPAAEDDVVISTAPAAPLVIVEDVPAEDVAEVAETESTVDVIVVETPAQVDPEAAEPVTEVSEAPEAAPEAAEPAESIAAVVVEDSDDAEPATADTVPIVAEVAAPVEAEASESVTVAPETESTLAVEVAPEQVAEPDAETVPVVSAESDAAAPVTDVEVTPEAAPEDEVLIEVTTADADAPVTPEPDVIAGDEVVAENEPTEDTVAPATDATIETAEAATVPADPPTVVSIIGGNSNRLPGGTGGVRINRSLERPDEAAEEDAPAPAVIADPVDPDAPALVRYAAPFVEDTGRPVMGLVLLEEDFVDGTIEALAALPFPLTVALNPTDVAAAERMAAYRAAGLEVVMRPALPDGATPADVEVAMAAARDLLPQTIGLIDDGTGNVSSSRNVTDQIIATLAETGQGYVTVAKGLNTGLRNAETAGVPAAAIFRDLDAADQDARAIGRFLEQAAFRARQGTEVVLLARTRPETLSALATWGATQANGQVAMGPVSAVLTAQ